MDVAQWGEYLLSIHESLGPNTPNTINQVWCYRARVQHLGGTGRRMRSSRPSLIHLKFKASLRYMRPLFKFKNNYKPVLQ